MGRLSLLAWGGRSSPRASLPAVTSCGSVCVSARCGPASCSSASCTVSWDQVWPPHEPGHAKPK